MQSRLISFIIAVNLIQHAVESLLFTEIQKDLNDDYSSAFFQELISSYAKVAKSYHSNHESSDIRCLEENTDILDTQDEVSDIIASIGNQEEIIDFITAIFNVPLKGSIDTMPIKDSDFNYKIHIDQIEMVQKKIGMEKFSKLMEYFFGKLIDRNDYVEDYLKYVECHSNINLIMDWLPHYFATDNMPTHRIAPISTQMSLLKKIERSNMAIYAEDMLNDKCIQSSKGKEIEISMVAENVEIALTNQPQDESKPPILSDRQYANFKDEAMMRVATEILKCYPMSNDREDNMVDLIRLLLKNPKGQQNNNMIPEGDIQKNIEAARGIQSFCQIIETKSTDDIGDDLSAQKMLENEKAACKNVTEYMLKYAKFMILDWEKTLRFVECKINKSAYPNCAEYKDYSSTILKTVTSNPDQNNFGNTRKYLFHQYVGLYNQIIGLGVMSSNRKKKKVPTLAGEKGNHTISLSKAEKRAILALKDELDELNQTSYHASNTFITASSGSLGAFKKLGENITRAFGAPFSIIGSKSEKTAEDTYKVHNILYVTVNSFRKHILEVGIDRSAFDSTSRHIEDKKPFCDGYSDSEKFSLGKLAVGISNLDTIIDSEEESDVEKKAEMISLSQEILYKSKKNVRFKPKGALTRGQRSIPYDILGIIVKASEKANPINKLKIEESMEWAKNNYLLYFDMTPRAMYDTTNSINKGCTHEEANGRLIIHCAGINGQRILATLKQLNDQGYGKKQVELILDSIPITALPSFVHNDWNLKTLVCVSIKMPRSIPTRVENIVLKELVADLSNLRHQHNYFVECHHKMKTFNELKECALHPNKLNLKQQMQHSTIDWQGKNIVLYNIFKMKSLPSGEFDGVYKSPVKATAILDLKSMKFKRVELLNVLADIKIGDKISPGLTQLIHNGIWTDTHREICEDPRKIHHQTTTGGVNTWNYKSCICNPEILGFEEGNEDEPEDDAFTAFKIFVIKYGRHIINTALYILVIFIITKLMTYKDPDLPNDARVIADGSGSTDRKLFSDIEFRYHKAKRFMNLNKIDESTVLSFAEGIEKEEARKLFIKQIGKRLYHQTRTNQGLEHNCNQESKVDGMFPE